MTCPDYETLVALWTGELTDDAIEEHLFTCDACAATTDALARVLSSLRELIPPVLSAAKLAKFRAAGMQIDEHPFHASPDTPADGSAEFRTGLDLMVFRLRSDLSRAERVDLEVKGSYQPFELAMIPFDATTGEVLVACQRHFQHMGPPGAVPEFHVFVHEAGVRKLAGAFRIVHVWPESS